MSRLGAQSRRVDQGPLEQSDPGRYSDQVCQEEMKTGVTLTQGTRTSSTQELRVEKGLSAVYLGTHTSQMPMARQDVYLRGRTAMYSLFSLAHYPGGQRRTAQPRQQGRLLLRGWVQGHRISQVVSRGFQEPVEDQR